MAGEIEELVRIANDDIKSGSAVSILVDGAGWIQIDQIGTDPDTGVATARYARNDEEYISFPNARLAAVKVEAPSSLGVL